MSTEEQTTEELLRKINDMFRTMVIDTQCIKSDISLIKHSIELKNKEEEESKRFIKVSKGGWFG